MISININNLPIRRRLIFFAPIPSLKYGIFSSYTQSLSKETKLGFKRHPKFTKVIDLESSLFLSKFDKSTAYEIRRSKSEGVQCVTSRNLIDFVSFYNSFLQNKKMEGSISIEEIEKYGDNFILRIAYLGNTIIVYHSYLLDKSIGRVRLLHSVSNIHDYNISSLEKAQIGRANRLLHFEDMIFFKEHGFLAYDFGGYAINTKNKALEGINKFKDGFGGTLIEESNYEAYLIYLGKRLKQISYILINYIKHIYTKEKLKKKEF